MSFSRDVAWEIVCEFVKKDNLRKHMLAVEAAMRWYAVHFDEDPEYWALPGLLHDYDWEIHPTWEEHPQAGAATLRERGLPEDVIRSIQSHAPHTGVARETTMDRALFASDELTGLITAVALVRPSKSILDVKIKSVKKKWKDKTFAAGVIREDVEIGAEELEIPLWDHVGNVLNAMQGSASELGLDGRLAL